MAARSLQALLARVVDYAGLFPPARLPLDLALRDYLRYRNQPESWMLGRFVIPAARLGELDAFGDELAAEDRLFVVSALGRGGNSAAEMLDGLARDLKDVATFRAKHGPAVEVDVLETRWPGDALESPAGLLADVVNTIESDGPPVLKPFFEVPLGPGWKREVPALVGALASVPAGVGAVRKCQPPGFKLRTGGLEPAAFPTCEQVAFVLAAARDAEIPIKFTAGLHHPVRRFDTGVQTEMHGFLNVFVAGVLAHARGLDATALVPLLETQDAMTFVFDDDGLAWHDYRVIVKEVHAARQNGVLSFGSCSFDEPREDLQALKLLSS